MIRPMETRDRETVLGLLHETEMFTPAEIASAEEQIDVYLNRPDQKDYFIVVVENKNRKVVGYLSYGPTPLTEGTYDLYWIAVVPKEQGQGYGKELGLWLERQVKDAKGRMIVIETSSQPKYQSTHQFYLRLGYKEVSRVAGFYRPGDDKLIYAKYLA